MWTNDKCKVTPCVGVWIEIEIIINSVNNFPTRGEREKNVTPCVGVWIEIIAFNGRNRTSHSLRGSVD